MTAEQANIPLKSYIEALRPKTLTASVIPVVLGTLLAPIPFIDIRVGVLLSVLFTAMFIQIGTNLINDAYDFNKGADTAQRLGPKRLVQSGLMTSNQVMVAGALAFAIAAVTSVPLVMAGGGLFMGLIGLSIVLGWLYTGGPYPIAYRGLGELFVVLFFGLVLTSSAFYLQAGFISWSVVIAGLQIGFLASVLIEINNLRDIKQDERADKRTLAVRFGESFAKFGIAFSVLFPFVLNFYWLDKSLVVLLFPFITLPMAINLIRSVYRHSPSQLYNRFLQEAAILHLCFGSLLAIGAKIG